MGALVRAVDWAATPLGPVEGWPRSLITAVTLVLESRYPMMVLWGPDLIQVYNDAFRPILGATKHPAALGQGASACWSEIWDVIGPLFARVRETGEAVWMEDLLLLLDRYGYHGSLYGHFGQGCLHTSTDFDLETADGIAAFRSFVEEADHG